MNMSGLHGFIQHSITIEPSEPGFGRIFRIVLITVVLLSVLIPALIVFIRRYKDSR